MKSIAFNWRRFRPQWGSRSSGLSAPMRLAWRLAAKPLRLGGHSTPIFGKDARPRLAELLRKVLYLDFFTVRQNDRPFHHIFKLSDVSGPGVIQKEPQSFGIDADHEPGLPIVLGEKMVHQKRNVVCSVAQRGKVNMNHIEAIE